MSERFREERNENVDYKMSKGDQNHKIDTPIERIVSWLTVFKRPDTQPCHIYSRTGFSRKLYGMPQRVHHFFGN